MCAEFVFLVRYPDCKLETISLLFTLGLYAVWARALHTGYWLVQLTPMPTSSTQRADSALAHLSSLRFFLLLLFFPLFRCFSRLAQENIFLCVCFLARALNSGANGVVYMKCRGRTGDQEGAEPRRRPEKAAHIGWRRGFARRIITSLTSLGLVVGMNNIATAEFSLHVVLQRGGSRLCRWLLWNGAVSDGRSETDVVIHAFRWKKEKGVAKQETAKTNILIFQQNSV